MADEIIKDGEVKPVETKASAVKTYGTIAAFAIGAALGTGGTYEMTQDKYDATAEITVARDTSNMIDSKEVIARPYIGKRLTGVIQTGDECRLVLFVNGKIYQEIKREITEAPTGLNDGFAANISLYVSEDRIAPLPENEEVK